MAVVRQCAATFIELVKKVSFSTQLAPNAFDFNKIKINCDNKRVDQLAVEVQLPKAKIDN
jgi:hypothetical protein